MPFCFQPLPRKARALPWQHWPDNEASMLGFFVNLIAVKLVMLPRLRSFNSVYVGQQSIFWHTLPEILSEGSPFDRVGFDLFL